MASQSNMNEEKRNMEPMESENQGKSEGEPSVRENGCENCSALQKELASTEAKLQEVTRNAYIVTRGMYGVFMKEFEKRKEPLESEVARLSLENKKLEDELNMIKSQTKA